MYDRIHERYFEGALIDGIKDTAKNKVNDTINSAKENIADRIRRNKYIDKIRHSTPVEVGEDIVKTYKDTPIGQYAAMYGTALAKKHATDAIGKRVGYDRVSGAMNAIEYSKRKAAKALQREHKKLEKERRREEKMRRKPLRYR